MLSGTGNNQPVPNLWLYGKGKYKRWLKHRCTIYSIVETFLFLLLENWLPETEHWVSKETGHHQDIVSDDVEIIVFLLL